MAYIYDHLAEEIFQILKGSGRKLKLYDDDGNLIYEPRSARRIFAEPDKLMVHIADMNADSAVNLFLSKSSDIKDLSELINQLRTLSIKYNVLFGVRKYGKDLSPKDFAYQISESNWGLGNSHSPDAMETPMNENELVKSYRICLPESAKAELMEALGDEIGMVEDVDFQSLNENAIVLWNLEHFDLVEEIARGFGDCEIHEEVQDKFQAYAKQWFTKRIKNAGGYVTDDGKSEVKDKDIHKQIEDLATGLKQIITGTLDVNLSRGAKPQFANKNAEVAFEMGKLLEPGSGLTNDALWTYISSLVDRISHGDSLDSNEQFFAQRIMKFIKDKAATNEGIAKELDMFESWINSFDVLTESNNDSNAEYLARVAHANGEGLETNPYPEYSTSWYAWKEAWEAADYNDENSYNLVDDIWHDTKRGTLTRGENGPIVKLAELTPAQYEYIKSELIGDADMRLEDLFEDDASEGFEEFGAKIDELVADRFNVAEFIGRLEAKYGEEAELTREEVCAGIEDYLLDLAKNEPAVKYGLSRFRTKASDKIMEIYYSEVLDALYGAGISIIIPESIEIPLDEDTLSEANRLVHKAAEGNQEVKVYYDSEYGEYIVKLFRDGKHYEPADYYSDDKEDAIATSGKMLKEGTKYSHSLFEYEVIHADVIAALEQRLDSVKRADLSQVEYPEAVAELIDISEHWIEGAWDDITIDGETDGERGEVVEILLDMAEGFINDEFKKILRVHDLHAELRASLPEPIVVAVRDAKDAHYGTEYGARIDELSPSTLSTYADKSEKQMLDLANMGLDQYDDPEALDKTLRKMGNRLHGSHKARKRVEVLSEDALEDRIAEATVDEMLKWTKSDWGVAMISDFDDDVKSDPVEAREYLNDMIDTMVDESLGAAIEDIAFDTPNADAYASSASLRKFLRKEAIQILKGILGSDIETLTEGVIVIDLEEDNALGGDCGDDFIDDVAYHPRSKRGR